MFVFLRDYLKKLEKSERKNDETLKEEKKEEKNEKESDIEEDNLVKDTNKEDSSDVEESKKKKKEKNLRGIKKLLKRKKKKKKRKKRKKVLTFFSLGVYIIFVIFFVSRICLLRSPENYELDATLKYNREYKKYEIVYDIEELWNDYNYSVGDKVCIPPYYDTYESAINSQSPDCVPGEVISAGNRVSIKYKLPKYISQDELKIYTSKNKSNRELWHVTIEMKRRFGLYQITAIKPN